LRGKVMEGKVVETLAAEVASGSSVALVSVISNSGSSPAKCGAVMLVNGSGLLCGTVGGGALEQRATTEAMECLRCGESRQVEYTLSEDSQLKMSCGGRVQLFIKVFSVKPRLIIAGGGHVGLELYKLGVLQGYRVEIFDDREGIATEERFPQAAQVVCGDPAEMLKEHKIDKNCSITITTHSHDLDRLTLAAVAGSGAGYIGMIGSTRKIKKTRDYLFEQGISKETIDSFYTPMGLNVATIAPKEIAVAIMAEILLVKNNGSAEHMRVVKKITV